MSIQLNEMENKKATNGSLHMNGGIIAAVDIETTGLDVNKHEIIQIAILPLDSQLKPLKHPNIKPFYLELVPENLDSIEFSALNVSKLEISKIITTGMDQSRAADLLESWFEKFKTFGLIGDNKRLHPLAQNWVFDKPFIEKWLGQKMFSYIFDGRYRDTMSSALYVNDKADFMGEAYPYPKVNLSYLASILKIDHAGAHDALADCVTTAEVYRRMLTGLI